MDEAVEICTFTELEWLPIGATARLVHSRKLPAVELITSVHLFCFSGDSLLLVEHDSRGWDIPGGHIEPQESLEGALVRELFEEAAAVADLCEPFAFLEIDAGPNPLPSYKYPMPRSYICCFFGELRSLKEFPAAHETKQRRMFPFEEVRGLEWYGENKALFELAVECRMKVLR